jgi:predicted permease
LRNLTYAIRSLRRSPFLALAVVLTTALSIGSVTGTFALINTVFFRELGVKNARELVNISGLDDSGIERMLPSPALDGLQHSGAFSGVCGFMTNLSAIEFRDSEPEFPAILGISGRCFEVLGVEPVIGRLITSQDELYGAPPVAVLSFMEWRTKFAANTNVIGQTVRIDGKPFTVVGVAERAFTGLVAGFPTPYIVPAVQMANDTSEKSSPSALYSCWILARRNPGASLPQTASRLRAIWPDILESTISPALSPAQRQDLLSVRLSVTPGANGIDMQHVLEHIFRKPLFIFFFLSGLILLICCVNTAGLFLARSLERRYDSAVHLALGATRWQLALPLILELLVLQFTGAFLGIPLAYLAVHDLLPVVGSVLTNFSVPMAPDFRVVCFALLTVTITAFLSVIVPCLKIGGRDIASTFQLGSRTPTGFRSGLRRFLIASQVALTLALVGVAGAFGASLQDLRHLKLGFQIENVLALGLNPIGQGYRALEAGPYYAGLLSRIESTSGITAAALSSEVPLSGMQNREPVFLGASPDREQQKSMALVNQYYVTEKYFDVLKIPVVEGRPFQRVANTGSHAEAILSQSLAAKLFPGADAIGRFISIGAGPRPETVEISGIISDARLADLHATDSFVIFLNYWQHPEVLREPILLVRIAGSPGGIVPSIRQTIRSAGREYPLWVRTLREQQDQHLLAERILANSAVLFGTVSIMLMAAGIFGLLSFMVGARLRELAIRIALGCSRKQLVWIVIRESLILVSLGALVGLPLLLIILKVAAHFVSDVPLFAPEIFVSSLLILVITASAASCLPCIRAMKIQVASTLKGD